MSCQFCANLLSAYKRAVSLYATSVSEIKTLDGNGFHVPDPKAQLLRQARRYRQEAWQAWDALMAHWRQHHYGPIAKTVLGNGFSLVSQEAEQLRQSRRHADDAIIVHWCQNKSGFAAKGASL